MGAATITELSYSDIPATLASGTASRRVMVHFIAQTNSPSSTINIATYIPGVADIEGVFYSTTGGLATSTAHTWSTSTLTIGSTVIGVPEIGLICTLT